jgi:hypothetical protein
MAKLNRDPFSRLINETHRENHMPANEAFIL